MPSARWVHAQWETVQMGEKQRLQKGGPDMTLEPPRPPYLPRLQVLLDQIPHLHGLPAEIRAEIAAVAVLRHYEARQVIYLAGEPADSVYLLEAGWVKATRVNRQGREQALLFLRPPEVFGDIATLTGRAYPCTVSALEDVEVWTIPARTISDLISRYPAFAMAVIRRLAERVLHYINLVEDLSLRSVEARLANTLLQHVELHNGQLLVPRRNWTTFDEMAVRLGTVRDVLRRTLRTLEREGLLQVERHAIVILDAKGLAERARS